MTSTEALLTEIRDLLQIIAKPQLIERDKLRRADLSDIVGKSAKKRAAVLCMDGSLSRQEITKKSGIDAGDMSRLVKSLETAALVDHGHENLKLNLYITPLLFEEEADNVKSR